MIYNNAIQIKRDVLFRTFDVLLNKNLELLNKIPYDCAPRNLENKRCCIHKDRAVLKNRVMASLGIFLEDEIDESKMLSEYGKDVSQSDKVDDRTLTVIQDGCRSCKLGHHYITDVCVGCVARPCISICPKDAIEMINGRSVIDTKKCFNCGKCTKVCSYNAVVKVPVPCELSCPVNALKKGNNGIAQIDQSKCINCGRCIKSCPFGAIAEISQMSKVIQKLKNGFKLNALIAPSIAGQYPGTVNQIKETLLSLGYNQAIDVANAAEEVAIHEANEFLEHNLDVLTSSCCPAYIEGMEKHFPLIKPFVSTTESPMILAGRKLKEIDPNCINVFIGPCLAKKVEARKSKYIDYVLTYEELGAHIMAAGLDILTCEPKGNYNKVGYGFAKSGGVLQGVTETLKGKGINIISDTINGIDEKIIKQFKVFDKLNKPYQFLEVMACEGGCCNGPGVIVNSNVCIKALDSI